MDRAGAPARSAGAAEPIGDADATDLAFGTLLFGGAWAFGHELRRRSQQAATDERAEGTRIARELHDVVSHSLSVVVVQTQAIRHRLGDPDSAEARDLAAVEATARQALGEMRRLFGVLRADGEDAALAPQPGLDQLGELLEQSRAAGLRSRSAPRASAHRFRRASTSPRTASSRRR